MVRHNSKEPEKEFEIWHDPNKTIWGYLSEKEVLAKPDAVIGNALIVLPMDDHSCNWTFKFDPVLKEPLHIGTKDNIPLIFCTSLPCPKRYLKTEGGMIPDPPITGLWFFQGEICVFTFAKTTIAGSRGSWQKMNDTHFGVWEAFVPLSQMPGVQTSARKG